MSKPLFNPQTASAVELAQLLRRGQITSVQIVEAYLAQIELHNPGLNALISRPPRENLLRAAERLDQERKNGKTRGPLHGIPIILKDCFTTASGLGMSTTCGSLALVGAKASKNSAIVQKMIDGGLIILAKANMTEFCGMKMTYMMPGWSAHGGQTLSPYVRVIEKDERILGHSPTVGAQDTTGMYTMTDFYDSPGPMAKSAADVRELAGLLLDKSFDSPDMGSWEGLSVGIVDPRLWTMDESMCRQHDGSAENMVEEYEAMVETLRKSGCSLQYPFAVPDVAGYPDTISLAHWESKNVCMPKFLNMFDECPVTSVADIVKFNEENKERAIPERESTTQLAFYRLSPAAITDKVCTAYTEQNDLIKAMNSNDSPEAVDEVKRTLRSKARSVLDTAFDEAGANLLVGTCDSAFCVHAAAAGYPVAAVPLSTLKYNGRPFGLCVIARADGEEALLRFMAAYEAVMPARTVPVL
ncbi:hypothetical protein LLEC1_01445 [Akanthomyces lecanii]|uniref:Amidase domain-containing protein n=1 Tax=Cordyceps confragosa TaxID=2714763 RepID=A0A179I556_CORDF|nr:hypothetical protein LLEC1_01445 [Akanthomyces lecanii]